MRIRIITIGEPKLSFAKEGFSEYIRRLKGYHKVEVIHLRDDATDDKVIDLCKKNFVVALDEKGEDLTSRELAQFLEKKTTNGIGEIIFLIGGPDGHETKIRNRANTLMSMSKITLPHDLAMLFLAEALYRASTINNNHPYHRD